MGDILYVLGENIYVNLTNKCPCNCVFCIRNNGDSVGTAHNLWLDKDPTAKEVITEFKKYNLDNYNEVVFCGYGEPTCALDVMIDVCKYLHSISSIPLRLNTNGLSDLIHKKPTAHLLKGALDIVSVSLNAPTKQKYDAVTRPSFGEEAFDAMLTFAQECKKYVPEVMLTVVDVIPKEDIDASKQLSAKIDVPLRIRTYTA